MAALLTVAVLVLAMSITFAFANRSLIFEQRTGANQMRSTMAHEVAEAGLEWALAQLNNGGFINTACATASGTNRYFSSAYISANANGVLSPTGLRPACIVAANGTLTCSCPTSGNPSLNGTGAHFSIELEGGFTEAGVVRVTAHGCTDTGTSGTYDARCVPGGSAGNPSDGYAVVSTTLGRLPAGLRSAPAAAITAKGAVSWQGAGSSLYVANTDANTAGVTINAGGAVDSGANLVSVPGTPQGQEPGLSVIPNDSSLSSLTGDQVFQNFMGMSKSAYHDQEKVKKLAGDNNLESELSSAIAQGYTLFWIGPAPGATPGSFQLSGNNTFGTSKPVTLVFNGTVQITGNTRINGVLYSTATTWDNRGGGNGFLRGAAIAEGNYTANGSLDIVYDRDVLSAILNDVAMSSYARMPGGWRDF